MVKTHCFILGNPRSGTSLLRIMLNQHPKLVAPPESGFAHWWLTKYGGWDTTDLVLEKINCFLDDLFTSKKIETWRLNRENLFQLIVDSQPRNYSELVDCVYMRYKEFDSNDEIVILDKNNYYIYHLEDLMRIWPQCGFIFLIRDGRDVACSYLDMVALESRSPYKPKLPSSISEIALEWGTNNQRISAFLNNIDSSRHILVKYEDLILKPRVTLTGICDFLNIRLSEGMLNYYRRKDESLKEPSATLDWKIKTLQKPDRNQVGRYQRTLTSQQIDEFQKLASQTLTRFGYV